MKRYILIALCCCAFSVQAQTPWPAANKILSQTRLPHIRNARFLVTEYGAMGDGVTDNTQAFKRAMQACSKAGGGHVEVPTGIFLTGAITLQSNVDLHLHEGAVLRFSADVSQFPLVRSRYQGIDLMGFSPLIYGNGVSNAAITGSGTIDASLTAVWNKRTENAWLTLKDLAEEGARIADRTFGLSRPLQTSVIELLNCHRVLIQGITISQASWWQIHPVLCTEVTVDQVSTDSSANNTDGCDPEASQYVIIKNSSFRTGDDGVAIKAGRDSDIRRTHQASKNIVVMNSSFDGPAAMLALGSEMTDGIRNIYAFGLSGKARYGLLFKSNTRRGGSIKNIYVDHISGDSHSSEKKHSAALYMTMTYMDEQGKNLPHFKEIHLSNIHWSGVTYALDISGLPEAPIENLFLKDSRFSFVKFGNIIQAVRSLWLKNVFVNEQLMNMIGKVP